MRDPNNPCLFCNIKESGLALENNEAYASFDSYPVSYLHCLIIPKRHVQDYFDLTDEEILSCNDLIKKIYYYKNNPSKRIEIAKNGKKASLERFNSKVVGDYMIKKTMKYKFT